MQPLHRQLIFHAVEHIVYLYLLFTTDTSAAVRAEARRPTRQTEVSVPAQHFTYLWIFHWARSLFCIDLYPLLAVNTSLLEALKTTQLCESLSIFYYV